MRTMKASLLAAAFFIAGNHAGIADAGVTVNIDLNTEPLKTKVEEIIKDSRTSEHKKAVREKIQSTQADRMPLRIDLVEPTFIGPMKSEVLKQVTLKLRGQQMPGGGVKPLGHLPQILAPKFQGE